MRRPKQLSAAFVKTVKEPGRYGDGRGGHGLSLLVKESTAGRLSKSWSQRLRVNGQPFNVGLGSFPVITLAKARDLALENRRAVADGIDPRTPPKTIPNFADAVDAVIASRSEGWKSAKTAKRWRAILETYAMPVLERKLVSEITTADVMGILSPIWLTKPETGRQVREHTSVVMEWAIGQGHRNDNPAGKAITKSLPKQDKRKKHFKALPFAELGAAIEKVKATEAHPSTKLAFELIAFTACRSGEARLATWNEIEGDTWSIPAARMKNGLEHRIPISRQALEVLNKARELGDGTGLVFPSKRGKPMTDATISKLLRENNVQTTPHGLRTAFRTWAAECSDVPREIAEHALAHVEGSASELAYRRTDYFERRKTLMADWSDFIGPGN